MIRPRRSALYLPASNARAIEKARELACDGVILDLEDAVAPDAKLLAREQAVAAVKAGGFGQREVVIRLNGSGTQWGAEDLKAAIAAGPEAILIPKVSRPEDLAGAVDGAFGRCAVWAMIETCQAILTLDALGRASTDLGVAAWVIGANDLAKEMHCRPGPARAPLMTALALAVTAARAHGIAILDGVYNEIADTEGFAAECRQGADLGFDGKTLIHPSQIAAANAAFAPPDAEVAWARTVAAAFEAPEAAGAGVLKVEGRMVERLHLEQARRTLALADAIAAQGASG
jgi:citrate lyase subunit beta / citryl-CoA lyase